MSKFFDTWKKIYGSKIAKTSRDFLLGKDMDLSDEAYKEKHGYYKPDNSVGPIGLLSGNPVIKDLDALGKVAKITLSEPEKYWYVAHQTGSANFPSIIKSGLHTTNGLNGTAVHLTEDAANTFAKGLSRQFKMSHEGADGMIIMKFPKSKFPSGNLDDISLRLMDLGESKNFEVPTQYLTFIKKTQLKNGGIIKGKTNQIRIKKRRI